MYNKHYIWRYTHRLMYYFMSQHQDFISEVNPHHKCQTNTGLTRKDYGTAGTYMWLNWTGSSYSAEDTFILGTDTTTY